MRKPIKPALVYFRGWRETINPDGTRSHEKVGEVGYTVTSPRTMAKAERKAVRALARHKPDFVTEQCVARAG